MLWSKFAAARLVVPALVLAAALALAAPAARASSAFPPIEFGAVPVGAQATYDLAVPLSIPLASIPASNDGVVLFDSSDPATIFAFYAAGFSMPVTIGQLKAEMPSAVIVMDPPTVELVSAGGFALADLGCTASACAYRVTFAPLAPGLHTGQVRATPTGLAIVNGGVLGSLLNLIYPLTAQFVGQYLVWDLTGTGVAPPVLQGAASRRTHGAAGNFDLQLSLAMNNPTTEPRGGAAATLVLTFDKAIAGATATVTEGIATAAAPTFVGSSVVVGLAGIANAQYVKLALTNVAAADGSTGGSATVRIGFLAGDSSGNRSVTLSDLLGVNAVLAQLVTPANYLRDVNASGTLTLADVLFVNARLTQTLPPP